MKANQASILAQTAEWVKAKLAGEASGHDWWHIVRVVNSTKKIAEIEGADPFICQMAALLHDMADEKLTADPQAADQEVADFLLSKKLSADDIAEILYITRHISFKAGKGQKLASLSARIVQDADRLDAIGAIGIARCMAYSGYKGRLIHDPERQARTHLTVAQYRNGQDTAIMHFYEKLLLLKDSMNTDFGRQLAQQRHQFLELYLEEFYAEWDGLR
ncbi:HD domain-containing protein [Streptococcus pseudoporcinus]|uniref:HD domain protein n=1 Tax=Streptococcus pseudoporcinus LQ 940-04 TaxID=875093 RepID=G5KAM1_9STRE|nr:HD domain-containing protein [Streptococcus pseudoporcinus]EFR44663.1 HD domain protein [Streptococcus pseudoporcinus SPIN 20026]EHI65725.1 HD domain protein [Streptococcus pseudoporcinus LQ 940-04]VEF93103.1 metal-dependent phosphohydrolase [Streptococcus pseudoporcinus]